MADYDGTAAHLEQQIYENPQSTPHNETLLSNIHKSNNPMDWIGMQSHDLEGGLVASYNSGHTAHLQQQVYGNSKPSPQNKRRFQCDQCPSTYGRCRDLTRHKISHHLVAKPLKCDECSRTFNRIGDMKKH